MPDNEHFLSAQQSMTHSSRLIICTLFCTLSTLAWSEESFDKFWGLVSYSGRYHDFSYMIEPQLRLVTQNNGYEQFLLNAGAGIDVAPQMQVWLGQTFTNFSTYNNVTEDVASNDFNEYRLWQQFLWTIPGASVALKSRLEERYSLENAPWAIRFRERGYWSTPLTETYSLLLSDEAFINVKSTPWVPTKTFDQNRAFIGILKQLTPTTSVSISYMNQYIFRTPPENNHAIVLNMYIDMGAYISHTGSEA